MRESLTPWLCSTLSQVAQPLPECYKGATPFGRILFKFFQLPPLPRHPPFCVRVVFSGLQACRLGCRCLMSAGQCLVVCMFRV